MKKLWFYSLMPLILFVLVSPGAAEFYRYKDQHGNMIFTDDLSKVPADQRTTATMYDESHSEPPVPKAESDQATGKSSSQPTNEIQALKSEGQRLLNLKEQLDKEYKALADESARLKAEQKKAVTPDQIKAINKEVVNYNTQYQAYQEKSAAYESDVKTYNERLNKVEAKSQSNSTGN